MEYSIDYMSDLKIVKVKLNGRLTFHVAELYSKLAINLARKSDCANFLIDHSDTILKEGTNHIHVTGDELQQFGFLKSDRIAILVPGSTLDTLSVNRNVNWSEMKYFTSEKYDESIDWLSNTE